MSCHVNYLFYYWKVKSIQLVFCGILSLSNSFLKVLSAIHRVSPFVKIPNYTCQYLILFRKWHIIKMNINSRKLFNLKTISLSKHEYDCEWLVKLQFSPKNYLIFLLLLHSLTFSLITNWIKLQTTQYHCHCYSLICCSNEQAFLQHNPNMSGSFAPFCWHIAEVKVMH